MTGTDMPSVEWLTAAFHRAVAAGDARGVEAALRLIAAQDARLAQDLFDVLDLALRLASTEPT